MNPKNLKLLSVLAGCAMFGVLTVHAQDKATLDLLVKKGVITQEEEDTVGKETAMPVVARVPSTQKVQLQGAIQFDYNNLTAHDNSGLAAPTPTDQMYFRRVMLGMKADLGNNWSGEIMMDFAATQIADQPKSGLSPQAFPTTAGTTNGQQGIQYISQNMFDKIAITKVIPGVGTAEAGYDKTNFIQEELISTTSLPAIERSIATRYFDEYYGSQTAYRLAFAQRRTGLFWSGTAPVVPGTLYYSAALTNGIQSQINYTNVGGLNSLGGWFGTGYKNKVGGLSYDFGINLGYSGDGNSQNTIKSTDTATAAAEPTIQTPARNPTYGWNPYIKLAYGDFDLLAEMFQARFTNGRSTVPFTSTALSVQGVNSAATPLGINIIPTYKITPDLQAVFRFTYLNTGGRGTDQNGVMWNAPNDNVNSISGASGATTIGGFGPLFNNAMAFYWGFNYNVSAGVRFSAGYEIADFWNRQVYTSAVGASQFTGPRTSAANIRAQLQVMF